MGVDLGELALRKPIAFEDLAGKRVAVDAYNTIYQFLSIIRQRDGTPLMDSKGNITSHLSGLFYRNVRMLEYGIKVIYVFDGKPPEWKAGTLGERAAVKEEAQRKWEEALREGRLDDARKYAQGTSKLTPEMVEESKELLSAMGIPWVQAKSEGEAEAAYLVRMGRAEYSASQDYDSLLFGSPRLLRNITVSGKRKLPGRNAYVEVTPEVIDLDDTLNALGITRQQLVWIGLLVGTDFNDGVKGIGPKKGLKLVKECTGIGEVHRKSNSQEDLELWKSIEEFFLNPEVTDVSVKFGKIDAKRVCGILCDRHEFSKERIEGAISALMKKSGETDGQSSLGKWF
ncbi:MAG: flap endonuclease-1 [Candidatus Micrarchaeota archaeon]|nr:flap endonuclease-1 [Candidatus Micrarchaeota archaeon]